MKKIILLIIFAITLSSLYSQNNDDVSFLKGINSIIYIDNSPNTYFTIEFPGDSLKGAGVPNGYIIGGETIQVMKYAYSSDQYTNRADKSKEIELLKHYMNYELDYLEGEVFKKKLKTEHEIFLNSTEKRFLLWKYKMPKLKLKKSDEITDVVEWQLFLSFVCNGYVCGINMQSYSSDDFNKKAEKIKSIANSIDIYGGQIDTDALWYKVDAMKGDTNIQLVDSIRNFEFDIPDWANIIKTNSSAFWMATMPDIDNVKNAVTLKWFDKAEYKSFKDFNEQHITNKKMGDKESSGGIWLLKKELESPKNCNGISYRINIINGSTIYHCQYVTYESKTAYFLFRFFATENTYNINMGKYKELLNGFKVLK